MATSGKDDRASVERTSPGAPPPDEEYSDLLLVDLLHPDWKNFFQRYRVDVLGLLAIVGVILLMILAAVLIAGIGA